jgi:adenylate cyclase
MKLPLKVTVISSFAIFTAATIAVMAVLNFYGNRNAILDNAWASISQAAHAAELGVNKLVESAVRSIDRAAHLPGSIFDWRTPEPLLITLSASLRSYPQYYGMFVGFPSGAFVQAISLIAPDGSHREVAGIPKETALAWRVIGPMSGKNGHHEKWWYFDGNGDELSDVSPRIRVHSNYDPRTRPWFRESQRMQSTVISDVYIFASLKKPGITVSETVYHKPALSIGVDLSLDDLGALTRKLSPGKNGIITVLDRDGLVIANPDPEKVVDQSQLGSVELLSASDIDDPLVRKAYGELDMSSPSEASFNLNDQDYVRFFKLVSANNLANWGIISVAAVSDFTGDLRATLQRSLLLAGVVMIFAVGGVAIMAGWITRPIMRLRVMSDQVTQLNLSEVQDFETPFDEINKLRLSMTRMRDALDKFLRFVPRDVVRELVQSGQCAKVGGVEKEVTMLFTDIAGFTTMTERMTPEDTMAQMSEYFENLSIAIQANRGTIDKFIGDAIMAFWNAPTEDPDHITNACRGMLTAYHISENLNKKFIDEGLSPMPTRFGLHCGNVFVGNVGASDRMQYTCLGSNVNLAARIEGLNKFYGTQLLVSDTVRRKCTSEFLFRRVDIVEAKGTTLPLTIYELMGERAEDAAFYVGKDVLKRASKYEQAFDFYLHRDFSDALFILGELDEEQPNDPVVELLTGKCQAFIDNPPPASWNGATVLDEK